jgi:hypothetical protein
MKITLNAFLILFISTLVSNAFAALPDPIDPKVSVNFSFEQRISHTRQLYVQLKEATSAERLAYFEKSIEAIKKLTPEERLVLSEKFKFQWKKLSYEQKKRKQKCSSVDHLFCKFN